MSQFTPQMPERLPINPCGTHFRCADRLWIDSRSRLSLGFQLYSFTTVYALPTLVNGKFMRLDVTSVWIYAEEKAL